MMAQVAVLVGVITLLLGAVHSSSLDTASHVDHPPPEVLISAPTHSQDKRRVVFTFEWNQDVSGGGDQDNNPFTASDVIVTDSTGANLKFRSWMTATESPNISNDHYYGEGVVKVDAVTHPYSPGRKFFGVVVGPAIGWVEAYVSELSVCKTGLCNGLSSVVRVEINPNDIDNCVRVTSSVVSSDELTIPLTFDFSEDVALNSFKRTHIIAAAYSLDYLPDVPLRVSNVIGGPRTFFATVEAINYEQLPLVEVWVAGTKVRKLKGGRFCESNHFRLRLSEKAFINAEADVAPQNRQFAAMALPYGLPSIMQPMPAGVPGILLGAGTPYMNIQSYQNAGIQFPAPANNNVGNIAYTKNFADEAVSSVKLMLNSVQTPNIIDGAVTGVKLANNAVGAGALHDGAVTAGKLGNFAIDARMMGIESVTDKKMTDFMITKDLLGKDVLDAGSIAPGAITFDHIMKGGVGLGAAGGITKANLVPGSKLPGYGISATTQKIADGAITQNKILYELSDGFVTRKKLAYGVITGKKIADGGVIGDDIAAGAVTIKNIANEAVNTASLGDGSIGDDQIARSVPVWGNGQIMDRSFLVNKLDPRIISQFGLHKDVVTTEMIVNKQINARAIGEDAVTNSKLGVGGVSAADLAPGSISREKLIPFGGIIISGSFANKAGVVGANIANDAVSTNAIATGAVTSLRIGDAAVDTAHLDANVVTRLKLGKNSVGSGHIRDGSVTNNKVGDGTVTNNALGDKSVTNPKIYPVAVLGANFEAGVISNQFIGPLSVGTKAFASDAITADHIVNLAIQKANFATGAVTQNALADKSVTQKMIKDFSVYGENYGKSSILAVPDGSVLGRKIATGGIGAGDIEPLAIDQPLVKPMSITNNGFENDSITLKKFADASVTLMKTREKGVDANELADLAITTKKLGKESVPGFGIADKQITNNHLKNGAVTARSLSPNAVSASDIFEVIPKMGSNQLADGSIGTAQMQNNIIKDAKIGENSVISANLGTGAAIGSVIGTKAVNGFALGDAAVGQANLVNAEIVTFSKLKVGGALNRHFVDESVTTKKFALGAVHNDAYDDNAVTAAHFKDPKTFQINARVIGDGAVDTQHVVDGAVTDVKVGAKSVQSNAFAANSVTANHIVDGSVISRHFANKSVTTEKLSGVKITTAKFADKSLHGGAFADNSITTPKIVGGIAEGAAFADGGVIRVNMGRNVVISGVIMDRGISYLESEGVGKFARNSITEAHIADGSVDADALADGAVVAGDIADGAITGKYIMDGGIIGDAFGKGSVGATKLVNAGVATSTIANGNVTSSKIPVGFDIQRVVADNTVYEPNFAVGAITTGHIQDGAVIVGKIGGGVTTAAIPQNGLDAVKIASDGFTAYAIKNKTLTALQMQGAGLVTTVKIADLGVTAGKIAANAITGDKIKGIGGIISQPFLEHSMDTSIVDLSGFVATSAKYRNKSLESESFIFNVADATNIALGGVSRNDIAAGAITADKTTGLALGGRTVANNTLAGADFDGSAINSAAFAKGAVTGDKVANKTLTYGTIIETGIDTEKLGDNELGPNIFANEAFTKEKTDFSSQSSVIRPNQITSVELRDKGVKTADIADGAVTNSKLKYGIVTIGQFTKLSGDNFAADSVTAAKIASASVGKGPTSVDDGASFISNQLDITYIEDAAVTAVSMQDNNAGGAAFATNSIGASHIANGAATGTAFAANSVTSPKIADDSVGADAFSAQSVTSAAKFAPNAVQSGSLFGQTIKGQQFSNGAISWNHTQISMFEQASEAVKMIDLVKYTVKSIDARCFIAGARTTSTTHMSTMSTSRHSMEDHHAFCATRGLGSAIKIQHNKPHIFHTLSQSKQLSAASSASSSICMVALLSLVLCFF